MTVEQVKQRLWGPESDEVAQLKRAGYDGLYSEGGGCACEVDDLYPCGERGPDCLPGYKTPCQPCECECAREFGKHDWHIVSAGRGPRSAQ